MRCCQIIARLIPILAIVAASLGCSERADLLVVNANIYTVDDASPRASAVAIREGRFTAVGSEEDIRSRFVSDEVVDAGGATMVPGLIDSHAHLVNYGLMQMNVDLTGTTSMDEVIARLTDHEETSSPWHPATAPLSDAGRYRPDLWRPACMAGAYRRTRIVVELGSPSRHGH